MGGKPGQRPVLDDWNIATRAGVRVTLLDGQRLPEQARGLVIGWKPPNWKEWGDGVNAIDTLIDLQILGGGVVYRRLFQLGQYRSVELPIAAYSQVSVFATCAQGGHELRAFASSEPANEARHEPVVYVQELANAAERAVPFGAKSVTANNNDAGWTWRVNQAGTAIALANPLTGATPVTVKGTTYENTAAPLVVCWEIEL